MHQCYMQNNTHHMPLLALHYAAQRKRSTCAPSWPPWKPASAAPRTPRRRAGARAGRSARLDVDVRDAMVLAEDGDVRDDVHGRDVGGDDDDGGRVVDVGASRVLRLAQRLDDFLDAAAEGLGLRGCEECQQTRCVVR